MDFLTNAQIVFLERISFRLSHINAKNSVELRKLGCDFARTMDFCQPLHDVIRDLDDVVFKARNMPFKTLNDP